jgi:hypothetical protein
MIVKKTLAALYPYHAMTSEKMHLSFGEVKLEFFRALSQS